MQNYMNTEMQLSSAYLKSEKNFVTTLMDSVRLMGDAMSGNLSRAFGWEYNDAQKTHKTDDPRPR